MKTFVFKIEIPDYDFTVHEEQIMSDFIREPGAFIEFIKRGIAELSKITSDEVRLELNKLYADIYKPMLDKALQYSHEPGNNHEDVNEFISKLIKGKL